MKGRKKKPVALKLSQGNPGKRRIEQAAPGPFHADWVQGDRFDMTTPNPVPPLTESPVKRSAVAHLTRWQAGTP